ncbi:FdtA/QdtA family cupin domain-containing protein [Leptospira sp. FAT2]|uniref:sugar 3,4-ketoisomerase n=1 Tax=Leptospira sanjuanensis TaxID=2879643 RepID=UPI001EE84FDF|nr:FdtA/QdtA family cupin domain-containing protein [Leptospira sanjuanensis]MCG6167622.1 FdtA/QdtA family cupin domain-containing protein [Leptospira sanjuanensis]MCG6193038.1 FdtA/QdtA family cupin domain-containing protein [Leptospira sanjuanensis]
MDEIQVKNSGYISLKKIHDDRDGNLIIMEALRDVPFEIKRIYYINNLENSVSIRGLHAHKEIEQVIFCINGSFTLGLDDGNMRQKILMNNDNVGVLLGKMLWHTMEAFSSGCVLMVVASDYYREDDYVRSYSEFIQLVNGNQI